MAPSVRGKQAVQGEHDAIVEVLVTCVAERARAAAADLRAAPAGGVDQRVQDGRAICREECGCCASDADNPGVLGLEPRQFGERVATFDGCPPGTRQALGSRSPRQFVARPEKRMS